MQLQLIINVNSPLKWAFAVMLFLGNLNHESVGIPAWFPNVVTQAFQTLAASLINPIIGYDAIPLPVIEEHFYTAAEVGEKIGVSANKIGRIANANNLKTEQYGKFFLDKSAHSSKQVEAFRYNAEGVKALRHLIHGADVA